MDLKQLCEIHAPSGDEYKLRGLLLEEAKKLCGEENVKIDRMGNVLCFKKGTEEGKPHYTQYTSCCNADAGVYYYTTYDDPVPRAVALSHAELDGDALDCYPMISRWEAVYQN